MKKYLGILFALVLLLTLGLVTVAPVGAYFPGAPTDDWQFTEGDGTIEWSTNAQYTGDWSVHMESNPPSSTEAYIKTNITKAMDIDSGSFWYNRISGGSDVIPHVDIWIDIDNDGVDDQWLLGIGPDAITTGTWVQVTFASMTWYDAMGTRHTGAYTDFAAAKADWNLTNDVVIGIGVAVGSSASWAQDQNQTFYVDDLVVNGTTYALEPGPVGNVSLFVDLPGIVAISVTPTNIDFGTLYPGETSGTTMITVSNIGTVTVDVAALLDPATGTVFDNLELGGTSPPSSWAGMTDLAVSGGDTVPAELVVPSNYSALGVEIATLIFIATPLP